MPHPVITIHERPATPEGRAKLWLRDRRMLVAGLIALAEVIAYLIVSPNHFLGVLVVGAVLVGCFALANRLPRGGLLHDAVWVVALAQAMVIALPILAGIVKLVLAAVLMFALIALFVAIGLRFRR